MSKRGWVIIILATLIVNVVSLQFTIEGYYGREYELVTTCTIISVISVVVAAIAYFNWRKLEYKR